MREEQPPGARQEDSAGAAAAVLAVDVSGQVIYVNAIFESLTGRSRLDLLGFPLSEVFRPTARAGCPAATLTERAIDENRRVGSTEDWLVPYGEPRPMAIEPHAAPIHDRDGTVTGAVLVFLLRTRHMAVEARCL